MARELKVSVLLESIADAKGFKAFNQEVARTQEAAKKLKPAMDAAAFALKAGSTVAAVVGGSFGLIARTGIKLGSDITDLATQADMGTDAFQVLSLAALDSGVKMEDVSKSAIMLRKNIQDASEGNKGMIESLAKLNLTAAGLQALAPERQWEVIAKRIATATDRQAALNAASELFGAKNAPKLMEVLQRLGTEGYDKLADSTKKIRLDDAQLKTLDDAGDKLGRIVEQLKYIAAKKSVSLIDGIGGTMDIAAQSFNDNQIERAKALIEIWEKKGNKAMADSWRENLAMLQAQTASDPYAERNARRPITADANRERTMAAAEAAKQREDDWAAAAEARAKLQQDVEDGNAKFMAEQEEKRQRRREIIAEAEKRNAEAQAERLQRAKDSIFNMPANDYQSRGLALDANMVKPMFGPGGRFAGSLNIDPLTSATGASVSIGSFGDSKAKDTDSPKTLKEILRVLQDMAREGGGFR